MLRPNRGNPGNRSVGRQNAVRELQYACKFYNILSASFSTAVSAYSSPRFTPPFHMHMPYLPRTPSPPCALDANGKLKDAADIAWFNSPSDVHSLTRCVPLTLRWNPPSEPTARNTLTGSNTAAPVDKPATETAEAACGSKWKISRETATGTAKKKGKANPHVKYSTCNSKAKEGLKGASVDVQEGVKRA